MSVLKFEEMFIYCRWEEHGVADEPSLDIMHLKKAFMTVLSSALRRKTIR